MSLPFLSDDEDAELIDLATLDEKTSPIKVQGLSNIRKWFLVRPKLFNKLEETMREKIML